MCKKDCIFSGFGVEIFKKQGKYFTRFDSGEAVSRTLEEEINEEEVAKMQKSEQDAYEVLIAHKLRKNG